jgi:hypothetical protein
MIMNEYKFTAEIARQVRAAKSAELWITTTSLRERTYETAAGIVRVQADWQPLASEEDIVRIEVRVIADDRHPRDIPAFVELFFHDIFLIFNIAVPASFGGEITITGGEYRVNDLSFDVAPFVAATTTVPLPEVVAWYRSGTEQIASTPMQKVLFHLLHIARTPSDEWTLLLRLDDCLESLDLPRLDVASIPVIHPMHDESLDERVDDDGMDIIDKAMARVLTAVQEAAGGK